MFHVSILPEVTQNDEICKLARCSAPNEEYASNFDPLEAPSISASHLDSYWSTLGNGFGIVLSKKGKCQSIVHM